MSIVILPEILYLPKPKHIYFELVAYKLYKSINSPNEMKSENVKKIVTNKVI